MLNIATVIGARPNFVKAAILSRAFSKTGLISETIIATEQHYDPKMAGIFFDELNIPEPKFKLGAGSGSHAEQTSKILIGCEKAILEIKPDLVVVFGDTNSTLGGALAAAKLNIPVAHIEAGMRCYNRNTPEEVNRVIVDHISTLLYPPTKLAEQNLAKEGLKGESVLVTGDVMYDLASIYMESAKKNTKLLDNLELKRGNYILATVHRAQNTNDDDVLVMAMRTLQKFGTTVPIVYPLHPRTKNRLKDLNLDLDSFAPIKFIDPVGYLDMLTLEMFASLVVSDSGGVPKEAYFVKTPCIILREETEWIELLNNNSALLVPPKSAEFIEENLKKALTHTFDWPEGVFGEGDAADKTASHILNWSSKS